MRNLKKIKNFNTSQKRNLFHKRVKYYLRDDIYCGINSCQKCEKYRKLNKNYGLKGNQEHYIILDSSSIILKPSIWFSNQLENIILLQSIKKEIENIHQNYIDDQIKDNNGVYLFHNEYHKKINQFKDNVETNNNSKILILKTLEWYSQHLDNNSKVILITENEKLIEEIKKNKLNGEKAIEYLKKINRKDLMVQLEIQGEEIIYDEYINQKIIDDGIYLNKYNFGKLEMEEGFNNLGYIFTRRNKKLEKIIIEGKKDLNRALPDDKVYIEIIEINEDKILKGKVIGIKERGTKNHGYILQSAKEIEDGLYEIIGKPKVQELPDIKIITNHHKLENIGKAAIVKITGWQRNSEMPDGEIVEILGNPMDIEVNLKMIFNNNGIIEEEFSPEIMDEVENLTWNLEDELQKRKDLRNLFIISIDPIGALDLDDAFNIKETKNGFSIGIHISDTTYFIKKDSKLDLEAKKRGSTIYLDKKKIEIFPKKVSSDLASLIEGHERLAYSCLIDFDRDFNLIRYDFLETIIKSRYSLDYLMVDEEYDKFDNGQETVIEKELLETLLLLRKIGKILFQKRINDGAFDLQLKPINNSDILPNFKKKDALNNSNTSKLPDFEKIFKNYDLIKSTKYIEELMILTNSLAALRIYENARRKCLLRRNLKNNNLNQLKLLLSEKGIEIDFSNSEKFKKSIDKVGLKYGDEFVNFIKSQVPRAFNRAKYCCDIRFCKEELFHYGVFKEIYTHFTSPIRRYADLVVHRILKGINEKKIPYTSNSIIQLSNQLNEKFENLKLVNRQAFIEYFRLFISVNGEINTFGYITKIIDNLAYLRCSTFGILFPTELESHHKIFEKYKMKISIDDNGNILAKTI